MTSLAGVVLLAATGCGSGAWNLGHSYAAGREAPPDPILSRMHWRDVESAISFACLKNEMAVVRAADIDNRSRRWEILTIQDEPATLVVTFPESGPADPWSDDIEYAFAIGSFGEPEREADFIHSLRNWRPKQTR